MHVYFQTRVCRKYWFTVFIRKWFLSSVCPHVDFQKRTYWNVDPPTSQENCFSLVCVCMRLFKLEFQENADPQTLQENGFSPVCVRMWRIKMELCENTDPHISQEKGFSPVWVRMCSFKWVLIENAVPQTLQEKGFSPVCVRKIFLFLVLHLAKIISIYLLVNEDKCQKFKKTFFFFLFSCYSAK